MFRMKAQVAKLEAERAKRKQAEEFIAANPTMSTAELAAKLGIAQQTVDKYKLGLGLNTVQRLDSIIDERGGELRKLIRQGMTKAQAAKAMGLTESQVNKMMVRMELKVPKRMKP